jgi:hypothetical protein
VLIEAIDPFVVFSQENETALVGFRSC